MYRLCCGRDKRVFNASHLVVCDAGGYGVSEQLGGLPSLIGVLVILTGIAGANLDPLILNLLRIRDWSARGMVIDTASHVIGTARALQVNELAGAFADLAMGLNALKTAILLLLIWKLLS